MIKEILKALFVENCTFQEASEKLGIDQRALKDRLLMLQHMGYIEEVCSNCSPKKPACCSCSAADACSAACSSNTGKTYVLTSKGEKICRN